MTPAPTPTAPETPRPLVNSRDIALEVLLRVEGGAFSNVLLPSLLRSSDLEDRDRAFTTDLVYGTLRSQRALDDVLERVLDRRVERLDPAVRAGLRMGVYQLVEGVAPHAAVSATVDAVARAGSGRARGFVNGVLRAVTRLEQPVTWPEGDDVESMGVATSHPDWIVDALTREFGVDVARSVLAADNRPPGVTLRPRRPDVDPDELTAELEAGGANVQRGELVPDALIVRGLGDPGRWDAVRHGRATPQDQGSQAVVVALDPQPGERVLEIAAAPGGKTGAIAELVGHGGLVVGTDIDAGRTAMIARAARRLHLPQVVAVAADGSRLPFPEGTRFDRVLLDAPCSGLGVLRRRAEARWRVLPADVGELIGLQRELLRHAAALVRPGGTLVYSVCTWTHGETVGIDEWAAAQLPRLVADPSRQPGAPWRTHGRGALLLPGVAETDGMYVLVLTRADDAGA
ncbi:MAG: rRNA ((967)-C(5))-methyltransferase [Actinomycetia bacterium]|nr:rRNA ((967)-C(5))-methyltransferase [Actinomycetes bacterium]